jgi:hypothetical protein
MVEQYRADPEFFFKAREAAKKHSGRDSIHKAGRVCRRRLPQNAFLMIVIFKSYVQAVIRQLRAGWPVASRASHEGAPRGEA